jgi:hypothetical protein
MKKPEQGRIVGEKSASAGLFLHLSDKDTQPLHKTWRGRLSQLHTDPREA